MTPMRLYICCAVLYALVACVEEPPPVSVAEFMENSRLLEATLVRCNQDRAKLKYTAECVNARDAIDRLEVREKRARHEELEAQSIQKRQALRQTQEAAAEARRRAQEAERLQEEAEFYGVYESLEAEAGDSSGAVAGPDAPANAVPDDGQGGQEDSAAAGGGSDLSAIREELQRRQQEQR